jgi:hypothetical protein
LRLNPGILRVRLKAFFAGVLLWLSALTPSLAAGALANLPPLVTDVDYAFDFTFFDGTVSTPHDFSADTFTLTLLAKNVSAPKITLSSSDANPSITLSAPNVLSLRIKADLAATFHAAGYNYELRHLTNSGATELLAVGTVTVLDGLSLPSTLTSPGLQSAAVSGADIIFTGAEAQVLYAVGAEPNLYDLPLLPSGPPDAPASGGVLFFDQSDNRLKFILADGTIETIQWTVMGGGPAGQFDFSNSSNSGLSVLL